MSSVLERVGRGTGVAGGVLATALWLLFVSRVILGPGRQGSPWVATAMVLLSLVAIGSGWMGRAGVLACTFVLSFIPVGLYLLLTPSVFAGIGIANLLYLVAAALIFTGRRAEGSRGG